MNLVVRDNKRYCIHTDCPYKMCPWLKKGVLVDKTDWSGYHKYRAEQGLYMLPYDTLDADLCCSYIDV